MEYTEKYHLPQWDETDRIMRVDFNQMCKDMEAGLEKTLAGAAELDAKAAADAAAADAKNAGAAKKAQETADKALADAAKAQAKAEAAYAPDQPPYVAGTYLGNGTSVSVDLGFQPSFLIAGSTRPWEDLAVVTAGCYTESLQITDTGFVATRRPYPSGVGEATPYMCTDGRPYSYIAFR